MGMKSDPYAMKRSYLENIKREQNKNFIEDVQEKIKQQKLKEFQSLLNYFIDNPEVLQIDWEAVAEEKRKAFEDIEKFIKAKAEEYCEDDEEDEVYDDNWYDSYWDESASYCIQPD
jgi:hypothetical protein